MIDRQNAEDLAVEEVVDVIEELKEQEEKSYDLPDPVVEVFNQFVKFKESAEILAVESNKLTQMAQAFEHGALSEVIKIYPELTNCQLRLELKNKKCYVHKVDKVESELTADSAVA